MDVDSRPVGVAVAESAGFDTRARVHRARGIGTRLVVLRARSSRYVLGMGDSDTHGRDCQREYETHGQLRDPHRQLAELELCLLRCARSGW
jgi:hypothetical protein